MFVMIDLQESWWLLQARQGEKRVKDNPHQTPRQKERSRAGSTYCATDLIAKEPGDSAIRENLLSFELTVCFLPLKS